MRRRSGDRQNASEIVDLILPDISMLEMNDGFESGRVGAAGLKLNRSLRWPET
jgi:hypothetical protein